MATTTEMHLPSSAEDSGHSGRFNYVGMHRYLITLLGFNGLPVFTDREAVLSVLGVLRDAGWKHHFDIYAYSFLPDRLILIARGKTDGSDMKQFLSAFRHATSDLLQARLGHPLWKKKYMERVLRKKEDTRIVAQDVFQGPVRAGLAKTAEEFEFQGSFVTSAITAAPTAPKPGGNGKRPWTSKPPARKPSGKPFKKPFRGDQRGSRDRH